MFILLSNYEYCRTTVLQLLCYVLLFLNVDRLTIKEQLKFQTLVIVNFNMSNILSTFTIINYKIYTIVFLDC